MLSSTDKTSKEIKSKSPLSISILNLSTGGVNLYLITEVGILTSVGYFSGEPVKTQRTKSLAIGAINSLNSVFSSLVKLIADLSV